MPPLVSPLMNARLQLSRTRGFTLIELMTAIVVLGVLLGIGVPSFTSAMRNNQIAAQSASLVQALNLARSESVKRGVRVSVCAAASLAQANDNCSTIGSWSNGWIAFSDDFGTAGVIEASDVVIQRWPPVTSGVQLIMANPAVTFTRTGRAEFQRQFTVTKTGCTDDQQRRIDVNISGRVGLRRETCA
jgi:type IV fimbrial biogenesis protein FimT